MKVLGIDPGLSGALVRDGLAERRARVECHRAARLAAQGVLCGLGRGGNGRKR